MNFEESREYIESLIGLGSKPGLGSITELLVRLGNPQDDCKFIHIAGTNGKGSILNFCVNILKAAGYKAGRYTSPAVFSWAEQFGVGGKNITKGEYAECMTEIKSACDLMVAEGLDQPTSFEVETALAFLFFSKKGCDIAVVECGMGGELDATNVIKNTEVACLSQIGLDHTAFLGDTLTEIATTKAGIIKPGCNVVSAPQENEVEAAIKHIAEKRVDDFAKNKKESICDTDRVRFVVPDNIGIPHIKKITEKNREQYQLKFNYKSYKDVALSMAGTYQTINAATAIEVAEILNLRGFHISEANIRTGLLKTVWSGRMELVNSKPMIILDGAHNPHAMAQVKNTLDMFFSDRKLILVMGMLRDKAIEDTVKIIAPLAEQIFTVTPNMTARAMSGLELAAFIQPINVNVTAVDSMKEAVEMASLVSQGLMEQKEKTLILITGTLSHLAEAKQVI